jgi:RNA polymerase sigma factor (sigma-70 family)
MNSADGDLLRDYATTRSQAAFSTFVHRHVDFVYGCALRRVGDDSALAEDVVQQVFVCAARSAASLSRHPVVAGWLFRTTRNIAAQLVRAERRRRRRESQAIALNEHDEPLAEWERVRPILDAALDDLNETDRLAILLRYFQGRSFAAVGVELSLAENAARMRVERALARLSVALSRRGVTSSASALALALANQPVVAGPAGLAAATVAAALTPSASTVGFIAFMGTTKVQLATAVAVAAVASAGFVSESRRAAGLRDEVAQLQHDTAPLASVEADNRTLARTINEAGQLAHAGSEYDQLSRETTELTQRLQSVRREQAQRAASAGVPDLYEVPTLDAPPTPVRTVRPDYPFELRRQGIAGDVVLDLVVDKEGKVVSAKVDSSTNSGFDDAALAAVSEWTFAPGKKGGRAVNAHIKLPVVFSLNKGPATTTQPHRGASAGTGEIGQEAVR